MNGTHSSQPLIVVKIPTADGATVAVKRKPTAAGTPIIFIHGLAANADLWDLPEVRGRDFHYRSLATILHEAGYDIWLMNLRGHGAPHMLSEPAVGQTDWCVDHFIHFDLPAVIEHVVQETARPPFVIGNSMGAMTLAGHLQGAKLDDAGAQRCIVADPDLAAQRASRLAGAVFVEFPAALRWPASLFDQSGRFSWTNLLRDWHCTSADTNYPFEVLSRWSWLRAMLDAAGAVPLNWLRAEPGQPWWTRLPKPLADRAATLERIAAQAMLQLSGMFTGGTNSRAEVILEGRRYILDHLKAGVLQQMAESVREGAFVSALGAPRHIYSDHYANVTAPTLVIAGGCDRIANAGVTREVFFEKIRSTDKTFHLFEEIAHGEFEAAPVACQRVYPRIKSWLDERK